MVALTYLSPPGSLPVPRVFGPQPVYLNLAPFLKMLLACLNCGPIFAAKRNPQGNCWPPVGCLAQFGPPWSGPGPGSVKPGTWEGKHIFRWRGTIFIAICDPIFLGSICSQPGTQNKKTSLTGKYNCFCSGRSKTLPTNSALAAISRVEKSLCCAILPRFPTLSFCCQLSFWQESPPHCLPQFSVNSVTSNYYQSIWKREFSSFFEKGCTSYDCSTVGLPWVYRVDWGWLPSKIDRKLTI